MQHLTTPQYTALSKWRCGRQKNSYALRVREDVYTRLLGFGYVSWSSWLQSRITAEGRTALVAYETKHNIPVGGA